MKISLKTLRISMYALLSVFLLELPFAFLIACECLLQAFSQTAWNNSIYAAFSATPLSSILLEESALMAIGPIVFPGTILLLLVVLIGQVRCGRRHPEMGMDGFWTFLCGVIYAFALILAVFTQIPLLNGITLLVSLLFHGMMIRCLWRDHKLIQQEKLERSAGLL